MAEAKQNVSQAEFYEWAEYRRKWGPLNPMARMDSGFALLAGLICTAHGIKGAGGQKLGQKDFMPYPVPQQAEAAGPEAAFAMFKNMASINRKKNRKADK